MTPSAKVTVSNLKPVVANPIVDPPASSYGAAFSYQFPANTFSDPDGDTLTYTASGMPSGVTFTGSTNTFHIVINAALLTIGANPQTKSYGATDPLLTFTANGFQFTDTPASVLS